MFGLTFINLGSLAWQYWLLQDLFSNPQDFDPETGRTSDLLQNIVTVANLAIYILAIVFFIMWQRRAYYNLHQLPWHNARYSEGWAAGSWFVPIINFWWPYQIMIDIWRGTQNALRERLGEPQPPRIVGWWWALYLVNNFWGIVLVFGGGENSVGEYMVSTRVQIIGEIISIPVILLAIRVVQRTNYFERELLIHSQTPADSIFSDNYVPPVKTIEPKFEN